MNKHFKKEFWFCIRKIFILLWWLSSKYELFWDLRNI